MPSPRPTPHEIEAVISRVLNEVRTIKSSVVRETLTFVRADSTGAVTVGTTYSATHITAVRRGGSRIATTVLGSTTNGDITARLSIPAHSWTSTPIVLSGSGDQVSDLSADMPASWIHGDQALVYVEAYRSSGAGPSTLRVLRAWQR
jgi:hypothetical protein